MNRREILRAAALATAYAVCLSSMYAEAKTVAIAELGAKSEKDLSVFESAAVEAGFDVRKIAGDARLFEKGETYEGIDAIVFTGGWNDASMGRPALMRRLIGFAARGGGVLLGGFRGGGVRAHSALPAFPGIACTYNRANSPWIWAEGDGAMARAIGEKPIAFGGWDHIVLKPGEKGEVFARNGGDAVGVCGEFGCGRVIVFGMFLSVAHDDADIARKKGMFRAMVEYLAGGDGKSAGADEAESKAVAELERRTAVSEWTADSRGAGPRPGIIPALRDDTVVPAESRAMLLEFFARELSGEAMAAECAALAVKMREVSNAIRAFGDEKCKEVVSGAEPSKEGISAGFAALAAKSPDTEADALIEKARAAMRVRRKAERAAERKEDVASIPSLVSRLSSPGADARLDAATELGRIGEAAPEVVAALVAALGDADDKVRVQAAMSLGWMQAEDAVGALIAKAHQNDDLPLKRRAIQALGQVGDGRAIPEVLAALDSHDRYSVENAILALGWLKAAEAVPRLADIASDESKPVAGGEPRIWDRKTRRKPWVMPVMNRRGTAVVALGYIGEKSAVPVLEEIVRRNKPGMEDDMSVKSCRGVTLNRLAKDALEAIAAGGRKEKGVRQPETWSAKRVFYGLARENNALVGRIGTILGKMSAFDGDREHLFLPYLLDAGMTGIHAAWGFDFCKTAAGAERLLREMDDFGLKAVCTMPSAGPVPMGDVHRAAQERNFSRFGDLSSYAGVWSEERWGVDYEGFDLGEDPDPSVCSLGSAARAARVAMLEAGGESLERRWRENRDWMRARRKGFATTFSMSSGNYYDSATGTPSAMGRIDNFGPEKYNSFGRVNAYLAERARNGETRSVMTEFYNWFAPSNEHVLRGCWQNATRSRCYYPFSLNQFSPFADRYAPWTWDKGRWELYAKVFRHVRDNHALYAVSPSATEIAVLISERSAVTLRHLADRAQASMLEATDESGMAIFTALSQSHLDADVVFIDNATDDKLSKYRVLFLTAARILTRRECEMLRRWTAGGGTLVCEGTVSLFDDRNLSRRCEYAIADILGVRYAGTAFRKTGEVFAQRNGTLKGKYIYPVSQGLGNFFAFSEHVWRSVKPSDCIAVASGWVEYDASLGIDRVELAGAEAVQTFED